jgi:hypothetical protein
MSNLYTAGKNQIMSSFCSNSAQIHEPRPVPQTKSERHRQAGLMRLHEPVPEMLQHLWQSRLLKQCPVDYAVEIAALPAGQVPHMAVLPDRAAALRRPTSQNMILKRYCRKC